MQSKKNKPKPNLRINKNKNICVMTSKQLRQDKSEIKNIINVGKLPYKTTFRVFYVKIQDDIYNYQCDLNDAISFELLPFKNYCSFELLFV